MPDIKAAPAKATGKAGGALTKKIGPLPAWGWGAVVIGGYLGYKLLRGGDTSTQAGIPVNMPAPDDGGGGGGSTAGPTLQDVINAIKAIPTGGIGGGTPAPVGGTPPPAPGTPPVVTSPAAAARAAIAAIPGMADVSPAAASYWAEKLGPNFVPNTPYTYDPVTSLAQWLEIERVGIGGTNLTPFDLEIGLANARARAAQAGVTPAQLAEAQAALTKRGGIEGTKGFNPDLAYVARRAEAGGTIVPGNAVEYIATLRSTPGFNEYTQLTNAQLADLLEKNWGLTPAKNPTMTTDPTKHTPSKDTAPNPTRDKEPTKELPKPPPVMSASEKAAELAAIKARAVAAGHNPTAAQVLDTFNRNLARGTYA